MKKAMLFFLFNLFAAQMYSQSVAERLNKATRQLMSDEQMKHGILALCVADGKTGADIFTLNAEYCLAAASTQKIFTAIAAFDKLGKNFTYKTEVGYDGNISDSILSGNLIIKGYGDPTLGSWRYVHAKQDSVLFFITSTLQNAGIKAINGNIILNDTAFTYQSIPGGWMWEDMGNYYGAGSWALNWHENQYDITLKAGKDGDTTLVTKADPPLQTEHVYNFSNADAKEKDDNSLIYTTPYSNTTFIDGFLPANKSTTASGAFAEPARQIEAELITALKNKNIIFEGKVQSGIRLLFDNKPIPNAQQLLAVYSSPTLDSIIYWFLKKSVNLYGESLLKTMGYYAGNKTETDDAVKILQRYWAERNVDSSELNIEDGSGLSPQNRVTAASEVKALLYALHQPWFNDFYNSLPLYNNMKLKSGTIGKVKAYAGYHTSSSGKSYVVSIIVNNYYGKTDDVIKKMFKVLDVLK